MEIRDYIRVLLDRWITVVVVTILCGTMALVGSLLMTPVYRGTALLYVSTSTNQSVGEVYAATLLSAQRVKTFARLAQTDIVTNRAIETMRLQMTPEELAERIATDITDNTVVITLMVADSDPVKARDLTNGVADSLAATMTELERAQASNPANPEAGEPGVRVEVVERSKTPTAPVSPKTTMNVIRGLLIGLGLGLGLAFLRDRLDRRIKDTNTLRNSSGLAIVGELPFDTTIADKHAIDFSSGHSTSAESFRTLRTNLQFLDVDHPPRVIVITSSRPEEGKSTIAINLALALAESGNTVCLLEGDTRRPRVARYLELVPGVGLTTVLAGRAALEDVQQPTRYKNMSVVVSGPIPPNPSELLGSQSFKSVLDKLKETYNYVIIDAPPALVVSDAAIIGTVADGVIFVARHGRSKRDEAARSVASLNAIGCQVLGAVLTMVPGGARNTYSDYYYYYQDAEVGTPQQASATPVRPRNAVSP